MEFSQQDFQSLVIIERSRKASEAHYAMDPLDADNLIKWGMALVDLSQFQNASDSRETLNLSISKLEEALAINPTKHEALWGLGNCNTALGFVTPDFEEASPYFQKAAEYYQAASNEDPGNEMYMKSLEVTAKAPELHMQIHMQQQMVQQTMGTMGERPAASSSGKTSKAKKSSDLKYDICGWIILAFGIVAWVGMAKSNMPPPPPPR